MKLILFVSILSFGLYSCVSSNFVTLSKQIDKQCVCKSSWKGKSFDDLRKEIYQKGALNFINSNADSLFFLESYDIESGDYRGEIWNKNGNVKYIYNKAGFKFNQQNLFSNYTAQLIQKWDTASIMKEEKLSPQIIPERYLTGIMVVKLSDHKNKIYCVRFKEFYDLKGDH